MGDGVGVGVRFFLTLDCKAKSEGDRSKCGASSR